jgi:Leucine-rich repeat (LRR) protein
VDGKLHGVRTFLASYLPTTERMHDSMDRRVARAEMDYEHGEVVAMRYFAPDGTPLCRDGTPLPPRPEGVDARATFLSGVWVIGRWTEEGRRNGLLRYHSRTGVLLEETEWRDDLGEGLHRSYDWTGEPREESTFHAGLREGLARVFRPDGTLAREADFSQGQYHGGLRDYDATGTRVVREVHFTHGVRQEPRAVTSPVARESKPPPRLRTLELEKDPVELNLSFTGLERVPDQVRQFHRLRLLDVSHNRLRGLPAWLTGMDSLQWLRLAGNHLPLPRTGASVMAWLKRTRKRLTPEDRRVRFCLFLGDVEQARSVGTVAALEHALEDPDSTIRAYAALALVGARPSPLVPGRRVYVDGLPRQRRPSELRRELEALGLTVVSRLEDADVLFVTDRPGALAAEGRSIAVETDLPSPTADAHELARLYATAETHPEPAARLRAFNQFKRQAPQRLWAFTRGYAPGLDVRGEKQLAQRLRVLTYAGGMDPATLADTVFQHTRHGVSVILGDGGPRAKAALEALITQGSLTLQLKGLRALPPELGDFPNLHTLNLAYNDLTALPKELGDVFALMVLDLRCNPLTRLPESLGRLAQLRRLKLEYARLSSFPEFLVALTGLTHLQLSGCGVGEVPESFGALTRLQELYLGGNGLTRLPRSMASLGRLTFLHMTGNPFRTVPPVVFELGALETLWLENCKLRELPRDISRLTRLKQLCLWGNHLEDLPLDALRRMEHLRELRVHGNRLSDAKMQALREALPHCTIY